MGKFFRWGLWSVGCALAALTACGTDTASSTTTGGGATADTSTAVDAASEVSATSAAKDQCQNPTDLAWLKSTLPSGETGREMARAKAGDCGLGCLAAKGKEDQCAIKCMIGEGVQLSSGCAGCYGGIVLCTIQKCLPKCIKDPQATMCKDCQKAEGCDDAFYACTGPLD
jgi:hypothetical protein